MSKDLYLLVVQGSNAVQSLLVGLELDESHLLADTAVIKQDTAGLHIAVLLRKCSTRPHLVTLCLLPKFKLKMLGHICMPLTAHLEHVKELSIVNIWRQILHIHIVLSQHVVLNLHIL